jgi:nitrogen regulatory protein P-II 1
MYKFLRIANAMQNALIKVPPSSGLGLDILKRIEAIVPAARLESAFAALGELGLGGFTYYESKGRGQIPRPEIQSGRGTSTYRPEFNVNATIVVVTKDSMVDKVTSAILDSTSSGLAGEGKIFVSDVDEVIDIGSKQRGEGAL